jgi:hypothetical protein
MVTDNGLLYLIILVPTKAKFPNTKNNTFHIKLSLSVRVIYIERSNEELHIKIMFT